MPLPHRLNYRPRAWRGDPLWIPIQCWLDKKRTLPANLSTLGTTWLANYGLTQQSLATAFDDIDASSVATGALTVKLDADTTAALSKPLYDFEILVTGGTITPATVFVGSFSVEGG